MFNLNSPLKSIALKDRFVPASSAPVERVFNRSGRVLSPLRTGLSVSHLKTLLLAIIFSHVICDMTKQFDALIKN